MINRSAYLRPDDTDLVCRDKMISVNSAGYYKFVTRNIGLVLRSQGREDYQMIYVAKGKGCFVLEGQKQEVGEGTVIFYKPGQAQQYSYSYKDKPEIYWIHFTGYGVERYLEELKIGNQQTYEIGFNEECIELFNKMITELQIKQHYYENIVEGMMLQLLGVMARNAAEDNQNISNRHQYIQKIIEEMHRNSEMPLMIKAYAKNCNISVCWFINSFKEVTGLTPQQYIIHIKINRAKGLLVDTEMSIAEIADIVGFQNAFYFSRVFKKITGDSPKVWRQRLME